MAFSSKTNGEMSNKVCHDLHVHLAYKGVIYWISDLVTGRMVNGERDSTITIKLNFQTRGR